MEVTKKACARCPAVIPEADFPRTSNGGFRNVCRACYNAASAASYRAKNPGSPSKDSMEWGLPAHDYTEADVAFLAWPTVPRDGGHSPAFGLGVAA